MRWANPRAQLLDGEGWDGVRAEVLTGPGLTEPTDGRLGALVRELDAVWRLHAHEQAEARVLGGLITS